MSRIAAPPPAGVHRPLAQEKEALFARRAARVCHVSSKMTNGELAPNITTRNTLLGRVCGPSLALGLEIRGVVLETPVGASMSGVVEK
eukprot:scaffold248518_cov28-Tisochrysis_lutea.AAC.2